MTPEAFTGPVEDLSTDQGFEFAFACARCGATWRSDFRRHGALTLEGVLDRADDVLGGLFGAARTAMSEVRGPAWHRARGEALSEAMLEAREHFGVCARCAREVCGDCWEPNSDLCTDCRVAPEPLEPVVGESGTEAAEAVPRCGHCGTPVSGGAYCPVCSHPL